MIWLIRLAILAAIAAAATWAVHTYNEARREEGRAEVRAEWTAANLHTTQERDRLTAELDAANERIDHDQHQARLARAAADADTGQRLRNLDAALAAARAATHPGAGAGADGAPAAGGDSDPRPRIAGECAAALAALEIRHRELADQTRGLQAFTRDVCLRVGEPPG